MLNLFRNDFILVKKNISSHLLFILLIFPIMFVIIGVEGINRILLLHIGYIMLFFTINFGNAELDNHIVIGYLPVSNREIVLEKYILLIINYILGTIYSFIILYILSLLGYNYIKYLNIMMLARVSFVLFIIGSIILPIYFYLTNKWYTFWSLIVFVMSINFGMIVLEEGSGFSKLSFSTMLISIIIIYTSSLIWSIYIYKHRDIE